MARLGLAGALTAAAVIVTACGGGSATTSSTSTTDEPKLGTPVTFERAEGGDPVGTIRFHEAVMLPPECTYDDDKVLGLRVDIDNPGDIYLPAPDAFQLKVVDQGGYSREVEHVTIEADCKPTYPEIATSDPHSRTEGWALVKVESAPTAIVFQPLVAEPDSTIDNIKWVAVTPASVKIALPEVKTPPAPAVTTTVAPTTTDAPAPPVVIETEEISYPEAGEACDPDSDGWGVDSSGGQLRCTYAGGPTPKWVDSVPFIGVREEGAPCEMGEGVAENSDGIPMVCVGSRGESVWMPGP